jgi:hypothetical protein
MGERFLLYRLPEHKVRDQARMALRRRGGAGAMRRELAEAVAGVLAGAGRAAPELSEADEDRLIALSVYATRARSAVERDGYSREIELIPGVEGPARMAQALERTLTAIAAIGAPRGQAWRVVTKLAVDCIPAIRRTMLDTLALLDEPVSTSDLAEDVGYPTSTARRALEDLTVYGLATRIKVGGNKADLWQITGETRDLRREGTVPENSGGK